MASFTDLVKSQRSQGKGVIGSLGGAAGKKTLEKIDPRNYLFRGGPHHHPQDEGLRARGQGLRPVPHQVGGNDPPRLQGGRAG